jgi:adenylyltransferase/sulfurtransferase
MLLAPIGTSGQQSLLQSRVLVVGAGGIGSTVLLYLAGAGIGNLTIVDHDAVEESNLHRQVIHSTESLGMNKALSARNALLRFNPHVAINPVQEKFSTCNALELVNAHDVVVDATDNVHARYLINDTCVLCEKPLVSGSAIGFEGQVAVFDSRIGPCYRCLHPQPIASEACKTCADSGVLGPVPGMVGTMQAIEVVKLIIGCGETLQQRQLYYDALYSSFYELRLQGKNDSCKVCGPQKSILCPEDSLNFTASILEPLIPPVVALEPQNIFTPLQYKDVRTSGQPHLLLDVRVPLQYNMVNLPGSCNFPLGTITPESVSTIQAMRPTETAPGKVHGRSTGY